MTTPQGGTSTDPLGVALHGGTHDNGALDSIGVVPLHGIILWEALLAIPDRFRRCNGTGGTTDHTADEPASGLLYLIQRVT